MSFFLALEGGGTRTTGGLYRTEGKLVAEAEGPASNPVDVGPAHSVRVLSDVAYRLLLDNPGPLEGISAAVSGGSQPGFAALAAVDLLAQFPAPRVAVTHDLAALVHANLGVDAGVFVIAGTGSCVVAQDGAGKQLRVGGRGSLLSDDGSAYAVAARALRAAVAAAEGIGPKTGLVEVLFRGTRCKDLSELTAWAGAADKRAVAALAPFVTDVANGDSVARACIAAEAQALAAQVSTTAKRAELQDGFTLRYSGGLLENSAAFRRAFEAALEEHHLRMTVAPAEFTGHRAALQLLLKSPLPGWVHVSTGTTVDVQSPTEARLADGLALDQLAPIDIARRMAREDAHAVRAAAWESSSVARAMELAAATFARGGRLVYAGAGTSGRLGVLDAAECPPTFGVPCGIVVAILAGGSDALLRSVEGAEDDAPQAAKDLAALDPPFNKNDFLVAISASGAAAYVHGAIAEAKRIGSDNALVTCNPRMRGRADLVIALDTGAEVLPGSTRLKAGTATKVVLNQISTGALTLAGYVHDGLMVGVTPVNAKLRERAVGIVRSLASADEGTARDALDQAKWRVAVAVLMIRNGSSAAEAESLIALHGGNLRVVLGRSQDRV